MTIATRWADAAGSGVSATEFAVPETRSDARQQTQHVGPSVRRGLDITAQSAQRPATHGPQQVDQDARHHEEIALPQVLPVEAALTPGIRPVLFLPCCGIAPAQVAHAHFGRIDERMPG